MERIYEFHKSKKVTQYSSKKRENLLDTFIEEVAERIKSKLEQPVEKEVVSARTLARLLDCSVSEIRQKIQENRIRVLTFGNRGYRIPREEIEKRLNRWKQGGDFWD